MSEALDDLITRLEKASGPDREIDFALLAMFDPLRAAYFEAQYKESIANADPALVQHRGNETFWRHAWFDTPRFTGSMDDALALVERAMPNAYWRVVRTLPSLRKGYDADEFWATVGRAGEQEAAYGPTPAITVCLALLLALKSQGAQP